MTVQMLPPQASPPARLRYKLAGTVGLVGAAALVRLPFSAVVCTVRLGRRLCPRRPTTEQATSLVAGVRWASNYWPGRCACLETSLGTFLAGVLLRASPEWCIGGRFYPDGLHAWTEVDGKPIAQIVQSERWPYQAFPGI